MAPHRLARVCESGRAAQGVTERSQSLGQSDRFAIPSLLLLIALVGLERSRNRPSILDTNEL